MDSRAHIRLLSRCSWRAHRSFERDNSTHKRSHSWNEGSNLVRPWHTASPFCSSSTSARNSLAWNQTRCRHLAWSKGTAAISMLRMTLFSRYFFKIRLYKLVNRNRCYGTWKNAEIKLMWSPANRRINSPTVNTLLVLSRVQSVQAATTVTTGARNVSDAFKMSTGSISSCPVIDYATRRLFNGSTQIFQFIEIHY